MQLEGFIEVCEGQDLGGGAQNLQCFKGFLTFIHPLIFSLFMGNIVTRDLIIEGVSDFNIGLNEVSIVVCEP